MFAVATLLSLSASNALADTAPQLLPYTQDWSNPALLTVANDWSTTPGWLGSRGVGITFGTAGDPRTALGTSSDIFVSVNQTAPNTFNTGGPAEFAIADPVVALTGSGTAIAPYLILHLNLTGKSAITVNYSARDIDASVDNAVQPLALQYRVGGVGNFVDVPAAYLADAATGPSLIQSTPVSVLLPATVDNQALVELRWISINASGNDEWIGIDNVSITAGGAPVDTPPNVTYNPVPGSINFPNGSIASVVNTNIVVTPSGGVGSGTAATTVINNCVISGAGAAAFGAVTGTPLNFVGATTTTQNLGLSCTIAAVSASANLSCDEVKGTAAAVVRNWSLNCPAATPDVPPSVSSTVPTNGATGVSASANLTVNFSEAVSTSAGWFALNCTSSGNVSYAESGTGNQRVINPNVNLIAGENCTGSIESTLVNDVDLPADAMTADFSFSFTVAGGGGAAPTVTFTAPADNRINVRLDADVTVIFNTTVSATTSAFTLSCTISGTHPGSFVSDAATNTRYRFDPTTNFVNGDVCTFTVIANQVTASGTPMASNVVRTFTVGDYYSTVNATSTGANLRSSLHPVIDQHTVFSYTQAWGILEIADQAPDNFNQILDVYKNRRYNKISDRAGTGSGVTYNREHTWPNSLGFPGSGETPYTDTHMLYLSDTIYNSNRGNFKYDYCPNSGPAMCGENATEANFGNGGGTGVYPGNSNWGNNSQYETWNSRKGDVARAVLYMDIRYEGTNGEDQLTLGETTSTAGQMASLIALRAWHAADPPDAAERLRNDIIFAYQGNRNPYIDHPEYVECLYANVCTAGSTPPNLAYNPSTGSTINLTGGAGLGSTATGSMVVTPSGGSGTGTAATTSFSSCTIVGAGFSAVTPSTSSYVGSTTTTQTLNFSCTVAAAPQAGTLSCSEIVGTAAAVTRSWPVQCPAAASGIIPISQVQGSGLTSPLTGVVTVQGIVTAVKSNGFMVQSRDSDIDGNPLTSEGILVFTNTAPPVEAVVGALVQVTGTISEFVPAADLNQPPITELVAPLTVVQVSIGNALPAALPLPSVSPSGGFSQLERLEHMRVTTPSLITVSGTAGFITETSATGGSTGVFFATPVGVTRPTREPGIEIHDPLPIGSPVGVPRFDANPELLRIDSDAQVGATQLNLTTGQTIGPWIGVLDYGFRYYTLIPDPGSLPSISSAIVPDVATAPNANEFTVASYNFQRFFDTLDDPGTSDPILTTTAFQNRLARASRQIRVNLASPDIIGAVEIENLTTLQAIAARVFADGGPSYSSYLIEGNDIGGIDVGFLVKTSIVGGGLARVTGINVSQFGASATFIDPDDSSVDLLNDRPPLLLTATVNAADGTATPIAVLLNHLRSLNGLDDATVRTKRQKQAEFVANFVQTQQFNNPAESLIVIGDFNAFEINDGYVDVMGTIIGNPTPASNVVLASSDLVNPNLTRLVASNDYSYLFSGSIQSLDHVLVNQALIGNTTARRMEHIRLNADFPEIARNDATGNARLSDHDALVGYFQVASTGTPIVSLSITPTAINEAGAPTSATLTATLSGTSTSTLSIPLSYTGTATAGSDYNAPASISVTAGNLVSAGISITAVNDIDIEAIEVANINAVAGAGYTVGGGTSLSITSEDGGTIAPNVSFNPVSGASIVLSGGGALGSNAGTSIVVTPSSGAGSGALATTRINNCNLSGAGATSFGNVTGIDLSFVGPTTMAQSIPLVCVRGVAAANANFSCNLTQGGAAPSLIAFALTCPAASAGNDLISLTQTNAAYLQNFDSLRSGSFQSALPPGWRFNESGTSADNTYRASTGSDNAGDTYAYGPGACDRAFGSLLTTSVNSRIGACFVNNTGQTINTLRLNYTGEQWRRGNAGPASDTLEFQYLVNPATPGVDDLAGSWVDVNGLDFSNPITSGTANTSVDGNAAANRAARNADLTGLNVQAGQSICMRWVDTDLAVGSDHGLAVDDFSLIAEPAGSAGACTGLCVSDVSVTEGNSGTTAAVFNVTLSSPAPVGGVLFDVRTAVDSASNFDNDFVVLELFNVSIPAGSSSVPVTVLVNGDTKAEASEKFRLAINNVRGVSVGDAIGIGTIVTDDAFELWQVQSAGDRTPLDGFNITTQQNVVTAVDSNGFFMQTPALRSDGDPRTSDAVFVFTGSAPAVVVGNLVNVTGNAAERFCATQISATGAGNGFSVTGSTTPIAPVQFNATRPSPSLGNPSCAAHPDPETANFECFENMLVQLQNGFVQGGNQRFSALFSPPGIPGNASDPIAEALITANGRAFRGEGFPYPGFDNTLPYPDYNASDSAQVARIAQVPVWNGAPQVFEIDPDALDINANQVLVGGQSFSATGVLAYEFDDFELWPTSLTLTPRAYPRAPIAQQSNELSIASMNLLRFYGAGGSNITTPLRCDGTTGSYDSYSTGASGIAEVARRRAKLARLIVDVLKAPDVLGVQEAETLAGLQALAAAINVIDPSLGYSAYLISGNDRSGINPGYLVRDGAGGASARVTGVSVTQLGFNDRLSVDNSCLHDRPPLRLQAVFVGNSTPFTVINNHTRSLLDVDAANADGARTRQKRLEQSISIRGYINAELSAAPTRPLAVIGDHNAFQFSDGWVDTIGIIRGIQRPALLASPSALPSADQLTNAVDLIDPQERFSYLFDGTSQVLDHALLSSSAVAVYKGFNFARNNVDAPAHTFALAENGCAGIDIQPGAGVTTVNVGSTACTEGFSDHEAFVLRLFGNTPVVSVVPAASIVEGNSGTNNLSINVSLSGTFPSGVGSLRVPYRIVGGSATENIDYSVAAPGAYVDLTSLLNPRAFDLTIQGDTVVESNETIEIELGQPIDLATGLPAAVVLSPTARRVQITINNDDAAPTLTTARIGSADRGASGGDFPSQSLVGSAREFRYVIEVPQSTVDLNVELFDADFGAGGAFDATDVAAASNFNSTSEVNYQFESPNSVVLATLQGSTTAPSNADGAWISMVRVSTPTPGRYLLRVSVPPGVADSNGYRVRARALPVTRGGGSITELSIYAEGYASLGHPASGVVGNTSEVFYPYVTEGCSVRTRSFDFDASSTLASSVALNAPNAFTQLFANAQLSGDGVWNSLEGNRFTTNDHANGYGIWSTAVRIEGGGGSANQGTLYFASTQGLSGATAPTTSPPPSSFRLYQAENGAAPIKPSVRQQLFAVSGANPPSPGNPGVYRVSIAVNNPGSSAIRFAMPTEVVRSLVPFSGGISYQGGAQPNQGTIVSEPNLGANGAVIWNPGELAAGASAQLTYLIEVNPSTTGVTPVTGTYTGNNGTTARFLDASNTATQFGPLCELSIDSAGTPVTTPVTLASMASVRNGASVSIDFSVATQVGVAGYQVFEGNGDLRTPAGAVFAASGDRLSPVKVSINAGLSGNSFYLQVLDIDGTSQWFGPFTVGASQGAMPDLPAIDWTTLRGQAEQADRRALAKPSVDLAKARLRVNAAGMIKLEASALLATAPALRGAPLSDIRLREGASLVPLEVQSTDGVLDDGDQIWFFAAEVSRDAARPGAIDQTWLYGSARGYVIERGPGRRIIANNAVFAGTVTDRYLKRESIERQSQYLFSSPATDPFAAERLMATAGNPAQARYAFALDDRLATSVRVQAEVWGGANFAALDDHHAVLSISDGASNQVIDARRFDGITATQLVGNAELPLDSALNVDVIIPGDNAQSFDLVHVDRLSAQYWSRLNGSQSGWLAFKRASLLGDSDRMLSNGFEDAPNLASVGIARVTGLGQQTRAWWISDQRAERLPARLTTAGESEIALPNHMLASDDVIIFDPTRAASALVLPWLDQDQLSTGSAEYLIVTHPQFEAGLSSFVAAKQTQGFSVKVVSTDAIYQRYGTGVAESKALADYLRVAKATLATRFVLLVGGDSYDPRNYLGDGSLSFVPTPYVDLHPLVRFGASDASYADTDGDKLPDLSLGRWPVRSNAELTAIIAKSLRAGSNQRAVMLADDRDVADAFSFGNVSDNVISNLTPSSVTRLYLDQLSPAQARAGLLARVNANDRLIHYFGHSGPTTWSYPAPGILSPSDIFAGALSNTEPNILVQWGCWNSYHVIPQYNTLAHAWLLGPNGAQAVIGAAALTEAANDALLATALANTLTSSQTIGEALQAAKREVGATRPNAIDVLLGTSLLGDPALRY